MTKTELNKLKKDELLKLAKKEGIQTKPKMTKKDLVDTLSSQKKKLRSKSSSIKKPSRRKAGSPKSIKKPDLDNVNHTMKGESKKFEIEDRRAYQEPSYELIGEETYTLPESYGETKLTILVQDPYWMHAYWEIDNDNKKRYHIKADGSKNMMIRLYNGSDGSYSDIDINDNASRWYFKVPRPACSYYAEMGVIDKSGRFKAIVRSNTVNVPTDKAAPAAPDSEWTLATEEQREEVFKRSGGYVIHKLVGSQSMAEWLISPEALSSAGSAGGSGSGGVAAKKPPVKKSRSFWAELHTELIVYGATEPDANVSVGGVPVKLNSNGTFSIRFYLKDGEHSVPFVATSNDKIETIEITPFVSKHTDRKEYKNK